MKLKFIFLIALVFAFFNAKSQTDDSFENRASYFSYGFNLNQYQDDFGLGLNITSSYFWENQMAVRLKANNQWFQHIPISETEYVWSAYQNVQLGLIGVGGTISNAIRLYGEGGVIGIFPNSVFSDKDFVFGGYGLFGFEFFMLDKDVRIPSYYIEIGSVGAASADKLPAKPVYSNGLTISVGFHF